MNPRLGLALSTLFGAAACGGGDAEQGPPNVLLISIDTLRPDFLGCYGHERDTSPRLDALAARGTLFEDVSSAAPWTLPGHATILTGMYPSTHGAKDHTLVLSDATPTLATQLRDRGYHTMAIVNSHNIGEPAYGLTQGFAPEDFRYVFEMAEGKNGRQFIANRGDEITALALQVLKERDDRPFFLFLHYYDVHTDFTPERQVGARCSSSPTRAP